MENNTGFIYQNEKGEFLLRIINRGHFDEDHYILKFVTAFEWACLFYSEIVIDENDRIQKEYQMMFECVQGRQKTIDELQARVDKLIPLLENCDYLGWVEILNGEEK